MHSSFKDATGWYLVGGAVVVCGIAGVLMAPTLVALGVAALAFIACALKPNVSLYVIFALAFFTPVTISVGLPGLMLTYVFGAILFLCVAGRFVRALTKEQALGTSAGYLLWLVPIVVIGAVHGVGPIALQEAARPLIVLIVLLWHVSAEAKLSPERLRRVALMIAGVAPLLLLLAVYQRAAGYWPVLDELAISPSYKSTGDASRSAAIMGHPILYSAYCMVAITVAIAIRSKWSTLIWVSAGLGLILSGSRSAWVATALVLALYVIARRPKPTPGGLGIAFVAITVVMAAAVFTPGAVDNVYGTLSGRLNDLAESESALARILRTDLAWQQITDSSETFFLGLGPGALVAYFAQNAVGDNLAKTFDNSYLTLWYEYGFFGAAALSTLVFLTLAHKGAATGKLLIIGVATQIFLFDFYQWPLMLAALALAVALREETPARIEHNKAAEPMSATTAKPKLHQIAPASLRQ